MQKEEQKITESGMSQSSQSSYPMHYDVKIHSLRPEGSCRAIASVNLNNCFAIKGIKIMESSNGLFVSMPCYHTSNGGYRDVCFPITKNARNEFNTAVLNAYKQTIAQTYSQGPEAPDPFQTPKHETSSTMNL